MKWTEIALMGTVAVVIGAASKHTEAGKGLSDIASGLTDVAISPFRATGRGLGELGTGITQFSTSIGGVGKGISEAFSYVTEGLQGLLGLGSTSTRDGARPPQTTAPTTPTPANPIYNPIYVSKPWDSMPLQGLPQQTRNFTANQIQQLISAGAPAAEISNALDVYFGSAAQAQRLGARA